MAGFRLKQAACCGAGHSCGGRAANHGVQLGVAAEHRQDGGGERPGWLGVVQAERKPGEHAGLLPHHARPGGDPLGRGQVQVERAGDLRVAFAFEPAEPGVGLGAERRGVVPGLVGPGAQDWCRSPVAPGPSGRTGCR